MKRSWFARFSAVTATILGFAFSWLVLLNPAQAQDVQAVWSEWGQPVGGLQTRLVVNPGEVEKGERFRASLELRAAPGERVLVPDISPDEILVLTMVDLAMQDHQGNELVVGLPQTCHDAPDVDWVTLEGDRVLTFPVPVDSLWVSEYAVGLKANASELSAIKLWDLPGRYYVKAVFTGNPRAGYFWVDPARYREDGWRGQVTSGEVTLVIQGEEEGSFRIWGKSQSGLVARLSCEAKEVRSTERFPLRIDLRNYRRVLMREEGYEGPAPGTIEELDRILFREAPPIRIEFSSASRRDGLTLLLVQVETGKEVSVRFPQDERYGGELFPGETKTIRMRVPLDDLDPGEYLLTWRLTSSGGEDTWKGTLQSNTIRVTVAGE